MSKEPQLLDGTKIGPHENKHQIIFNQYEALEKGAAFVLRNGHDPVPLYYQMTSIYGEGTFSWEYQKKGPDVFEILITKK